MKLITGIIWLVNAYIFIHYSIIRDNEYLIIPSILCFILAGKSGYDFDKQLRK